MKKLIMLTVFIACSLVCIDSSAKTVDVTLPDYKCVMNGQTIENDSLYPMLAYNDITYLPLTYDNCIASGVLSLWENGELWLAYSPYYVGMISEQEKTVNKRQYTVEIAEYPIYINGEQINNFAMEYPLLNFRGVTYLPLAYDFVHDEFNWKPEFKDNTLRVRIGLSGDFDCWYSLVDVLEEYAIIREEKQSGNNPTTRYYAFNYGDESMRLIEGDYTDKYYSYKRNPQSFEATIENGRIVYEGKEFAEFIAIKEGAASEGDYTFYREHDVFGDISAYTFHITYEKKLPEQYYPYQSYTYLKLNGSLVFLDEYICIDNIVRCGEDIYVNAQGRDRTMGAVYSFSNRLYRIKPDGSISIVNHEFPDYGNMEIIGAAQDKLYLRCEWRPEGRFPTYETKISPVKDGFFTYDGKSLTKIAPYMYTNGDFVAPDGKLFSIINLTAEIKRIN